MQPVTLIVATRNEHKLGEIRSMMCAQNGSVRVLSLAELPGAPVLVEDGKSFAENAAKKAVQVANWLAEGAAQEIAKDAELAVLADDSGLEVDALNGQPGVQSARFAASENGGNGNASDGENNAKLLRLLSNVPLEKRTARFRCFLALGEVAHQKPLRTEDVKLFEGTCEGLIGLGPRGELGFGYDPLFLPEGDKRSFGELGEEEKNKISHRSRALEKLKAHLESRE